MTQARKLRVELIGSAKSLISALDESEGRFGKFGKAAGLAMAGIGGAAVAGAAQAVMAFAGFDKSMNEVFTLLPGISHKAMDQMTGQVKDFSKEFGVLPEKVVPALYQSLSAGVPADNVFAFLETANKAAKGGVTDLTTAVDGITSVVNAYGAEVVSATQASDFMLTTVRLGKTTFADLSASLFQVTPTAAALGVSFGDVTAALAAMTLQGVPTSVATTQLRQLFVELSKETSATADTFKSLSGQSFKEFIAGGGNVQQALQLLESDAAAGGKGINDLFSSVEAGSAALALTGTGTQKFTDSLAGMANSAGATDTAFNTMNKGIGPLIDRAKAFASVWLIDIGDKIANVIMAVASGFTSMDVTSDGLFGKLEGVGVGLRRIVDAVIANWPKVRDVIAEVMTKVKSVIDMVVSDIMVIWDNFGSQIFSVIKIAWTFISNTIENALSVIQGIVKVVTGLIHGDWGQVWDGIKQIFGAVWDQIKNILSTAMGLIREVLSIGWELVKGIFTGAWDAIKTGVTEGVGSVVEWLAGLPGKILGALGDLASLLLNIGKDIINGLWNGMKKAWDNVTSWVGGLAGKIARLKGPLDYDRRLLTPAGAAIMQGLMAGLASEESRLVDQLAGITGLFSMVGGTITPTLGASSAPTVPGPLSRLVPGTVPGGVGTEGGVLAVRLDLGGGVLIVSEAGADALARRLGPAMVEELRRQRERGVTV